MAKKTYTDSETLLRQQDLQLTENRRERLAHAVVNRQRGLMVLMEDVLNPHNLAAIARTCDAFGIQHIACTLENHELFDPLEIGRMSSSSASKWLDYRLFQEGTEACFNTLKGEGWHIMATVVGNDVPDLYDVDLTRYDKLAILVGNERKGISKTAECLADSHITIPMRGMIRSLNVSVATAIIISEVVRQREASDKDFRLPIEEAQTLIRDFANRKKYSR